MRVCVPQPDNSSQHPQNQRPLLPPAQQHLGHTASAFARVLRVRRISTLFIRASLTQVTLSSNVFLATQTPRLSLFRHSEWGRGISPALFFPSASPRYTFPHSFHSPAPLLATKPKCYTSFVNQRLRYEIRGLAYWAECANTFRNTVTARHLP